MAVTYIPAGYHTVTPYLHIRGCVAAIEFYKKAFGATEVLRLPMPDGKLGHAEIKIGDSHVMMADEMPEFGNRSPTTLGGPSGGLCLYIPDCDAMFDKALAEGATVLRPLADQFYGDRSGTVSDPFGHVWTIATHIEDVPPEEMHQRMEEWTKSQQPA